MTNYHRFLYETIVGALGIIGIKKGVFVYRVEDGQRGYISDFEGDSVTKTKFEFSVYVTMENGQRFAGTFLDFFKTYNILK